MTKERQNRHILWSPKYTGNLNKNLLQACSKGSFGISVRKLNRVSLKGMAIWYSLFDRVLEFLVPS